MRRVDRRARIFEIRSRSDFRFSDLTDHALPLSDAPIQRWLYRGTSMSKVEKLQKNRNLQMAPCNSPSKTGIDINQSGLLTQVWSLAHIW